MRVLSDRISAATAKNNVTVDPSLHNYLCGVMEERNSSVTSDFPDGSFQRLFWDQQIKAARTSKPKA